MRWRERRKISALSSAFHGSMMSCDRLIAIISSRENGKLLCLIATWVNHSLTIGSLMTNHLAKYRSVDAPTNFTSFWMPLDLSHLWMHRPVCEFYTIKSVFSDCSDSQKKFRWLQNVFQNVEWFIRINFVDQRNIPVLRNKMTRPTQDFSVSLCNSNAASAAAKGRK